MKILGLHHSWPVVIVGAGNLGTALSMYSGFRNRGFRVIAIFDSDPHKVGYKLSGIEIYPLSEMEQIISKAGNVIGIIAVPSEHAQATADLLVKAGARAILNFAPCILKLPEDMIFRNVDLSVNLEILTFNLGYRKERK
jgi:redox-sensing transcriptional repressor